MQNKLIESIANTVLLLLFFMAAVSYNGKLFGYKTEELFTKKQQVNKIHPPNTTQLNELGIHAQIGLEEQSGVWFLAQQSNADRIVNTQAFSKEIYGFGGQIPMLLHINSKKQIQNILLMENNETPDFISSVRKKGIISQWIGKNLHEITSQKADVLSGATMTSRAINQSILKSMQAINEKETGTNWLAAIDLKTLVAIFVILMGVIVSFRSKGRKQIRSLQLLLNTIVLGIWCGQFISVNILLGWTANGMNLLSGGVVFLLLVLALIMPLFFKKKGFYCNWLCPFGSAQELAGKLSKKKLQPGQKLTVILKHSQQLITLALFFCLWMGIAADIADYEPFSAFIFQHASTAVLLIAGLSLTTSIITPRPWCRFVCPTGQILKWTHKM